MRTTRLLLASLALVLFATGCDGGMVVTSPAPAYPPAAYSYEDAYPAYGYAQPVAGVSVGAQVTLGDFQATLAPYGSWYDYEDYGPIWVPSAAIVGADFAPYTCGQWVYTNDGWAWSSCYAWGWAPFHYGRWAFLTDIGWAWFPGYTWGPAWVDWRMGGGYVGWAPEVPAGFAYAPTYYGHWHFVADRDFDRPRPTYVPPGQVPVLLQRTRPFANRATVGNVRIDRGPPPSQIEHVAGRPIVPRPVTSLPRALPPRREPTRPAPQAIPRAQLPRIAPGTVVPARPTFERAPAPPPRPTFQRAPSPPPRPTFERAPAPQPRPVFRPAPAPRPRPELAPRQRRR